MKVLDVGSGYEGESVAEIIFKDAPDLNVVRMDIDPERKPDIIHDLLEPLPEEHHGAYDVVVASHVLEHIERDGVLVAVKNISKAVRMGGELWVMVPSLEWAADEIRRGRSGKHVQLSVFGGQWSPYDFHKSGFTLSNLRQLVEMAGFVTRKAYQSPFIVGVDGESWQVLQNVVIGLKVGEIVEVENDRPGDDPG